MIDNERRRDALDRALMLAASEGVTCQKCIIEMAQHFDAFLERGNNTAAHPEAAEEDEPEDQAVPGGIIPFPGGSKH